MTVIDCACDSKMATELANYLKNHGLDPKIEESLVIISNTNVEQILKSFLEESKYTDYSIRILDSTTILLAREVQIEDLGFFKCEMCGHVLSNKADLIVHRRIHGFV